MGQQIIYSTTQVHVENYSLWDSDKRELLCNIYIYSISIRMYANGVGKKKEVDFFLYIWCL